MRSSPGSARRSAMIGARKARTSASAWNPFSRRLGSATLETPPAAIVRYQSRKRAASSTAISSVIASRGIHIA